MTQNIRRLSRAEMAAKVKAKVDLPAPFGPIRAVTSPG